MNARTKQTGDLELQVPRNVAEALAISMREWELGPVYGVSGANIESFHDALHVHGGDRVWSVAARSESGAAFMADARARTHGTLGVCCSTSGGGMMNLAVGIAESYQEGIPVLAIVGQIPTALEGVGGFQDSAGIGNTVDAHGLWKSIAKDVREIRSGETFWEDLYEAVRAAMSGRRGPSVLLIPRNVFAEPVPTRPKHWPARLESLLNPRLPAADKLSELDDLLAESKHPVFVVGKGVKNCSAPSALATYARMAQIPVVTTMADIAAFPNEDPLYLGMIGTAGHPSVHRYINKEADLIVVAGSQLEIMMRAPIMKGLTRCPVVIVNDDVSTAERTFPEALTLEGDVGLTFLDLMSRDDKPVEKSGRPQGYELECFVPILAEQLPDEPLPIVANMDATLLQSEAIFMLQDALPKNGHLVFDAGNCAASTLHYLKAPAGNSTTIALGMGGMGYAIPGAVGAQEGSAEGTRTTVFCGDGAFLLLGMEVHTAVELGLPVLFVVFNNGKHGMCVTRQQLWFESRIECSRYSKPSIKQIARGFGDEDALWVDSAETPWELESALQSLENWDWKGPAVLELVIHREEVPPFTPFLEDDAPVAQPAQMVMHRRKEVGQAEAA